MTTEIKELKPKQKKPKKKAKVYSHVYKTPQGDLVYVSKKMHDKIQSTQDWHNQTRKAGTFEYQSRNMFDVILQFQYIKKVELKNIKNFIMQFQTYVTNTYPIAKEPKCRFNIEFKAKLKYDMIADLFISGRPLFLEIMKEEDIELRELKLQYFFEPYGYPLYKLPNCNSKELWSGLVSDDAMEELKTKRKPEIEREHAMARSVVIPKLFTEYFEFIEIARGDFLKTLFENEGGYGTFHLVTRKENSKLKEFQTEEIMGDPLSAYVKAGINLIDCSNRTDVLYNVPKANWWVTGKARDAHYKKGLLKSVDTIVKTALTDNDIAGKTIPNTIANAVATTTKIPINLKQFQSPGISILEED